MGQRLELNNPKHGHRGIKEPHLNILAINA